MFPNGHDNGVRKRSAPKIIEKSINSFLPFCRLLNGFSDCRYERTLRPQAEAPVSAGAGSVVAGTTGIVAAGSGGDTGATGSVATGAAIGADAADVSANEDLAPPVAGPVAITP